MVKLYGGVKYGLPEFVNGHSFDRAVAEELIYAVNRLDSLGVAPGYVSRDGKEGNFGNGGVRYMDPESGEWGVLVTPSGLKFQDLKTEDLVMIKGLNACDKHGVRPVVVSPRKNMPTSEASLYYDALVKRFDELCYGALLHGHDRAITDARDDLVRKYLDGMTGITEFNGEYGTSEFSDAVNGIVAGRQGFFGVIAPFHDAPTGGFFSYGNSMADSLYFTEIAHEQAVKLQ